MKRIKNHGKFKSKFEVLVAANIKAVLGRDPPYEPTKYKFKVAVRNRQGTCLACGSNAVAKYSTYSPDFEIRASTFIEAKGKFTAANRTRLIAFAEEHPSVKIYLLFQRDNWLSKRHASKYSDWARQYGFDYTVGTHPDKLWFRT